MNNEGKIHAIITSVSLDRIGGVTNYIKLLMRHLPSHDLKVSHFEQGKSTRKILNILLPILIVGQIRKFKRFLVNEKPDVVHLNPSLGWSALIRDFTFLKLAKKNGVPALFFIHGWNEKLFSAISSNGILKRYFHKNISYADAIVVLSKDFKYKLTKMNIPEERIFQFTTMVDTNIYHAKERKLSKPYQVLFCARMDEKKGSFELMEAIPTILDSMEDLMFIFIGKGDVLDELKGKVTDDFRKHVKILGFVEEKEKIKIFNRSHIFVYPSYYGEGFPTVILEAMASGMPVITTPVGGLLEAIRDGKQGRVLRSVPPNPEEIANLILELVSNPDALQKMSKNNRLETIEKYDVMIITKKICDIYKAILPN